MNNIDKIIKYSKNLRLLFVEDNQEARESTALILEEFFNEIVVACNGKEGFESFKSNDIDLIITDINMPKLNGLQMSRKIREIDSNVPILVLSAYNESSYIMDSIKLGVDGYLLKPIEIEQFLQALYKCIENINLKKENVEYKNSLEKKVEKQVKELREKDRLLAQQSKMAIMGEMIDAIAHQWKQPLSVISMQKDLVNMDMQEGKLNNQLIQNAIDITTYQIKHLVDTIGEFRNFFRPNNNITPLNIKALLNSISVLLKDELIQHMMRLDILCSADIVIDANENDIKHLFINLINNAKDEMKDSAIKSEERVITIECTKEKSEVKFLVKDNGRGIPQDIIKDIFKPHFTTKEDDNGTGIGLYMCKQIVDKYGANIDVSNDNGAVFYISFLQKSP